MKLNVGFVGFDGTESKRAIPAIHLVKETEKIKGDMNVLLRSPHGRAKSMLSKFVRMCDVRAFLTDEKDRAAWEKAGAKIEGGYGDFFEESDAIIIGTPEGQELPYVEASMAHDCSMVLMGGAKRSEILDGLALKNIEITDEIKEDLGREFFFGLGNYDRFLKAAPQLVQCTSCNTTAEPSWRRDPLDCKPSWATWIAEAGTPKTSSRCLQTLFSSEMASAIRGKMRQLFLKT
jgi:glyceraldehyde-3-phosphate dehydrogenase (NAD(P))